MTQRLGIDVGGTFTDVVVMRADGSVAVEKVASTPHDPAGGIFSGIRKVKATRGINLSEIDIFSQGSTVATNALLEFKLPRTALVVTRGFADVLEIGNQVRPETYNLRVVKPTPYIPRDMVFEVSERVDRLGSLVTPMSDGDVDEVVDKLISSGVEACAVCLLFSFRNPDHERRILARIRERAPHIEVAISSAVAPEIGEYARANTVSVSAALQPLIASYMSKIVEGSVDVGLDCPSYVMQSNGGVMSVIEAAENAHRMVLSGPAGGVLAATKVARTSGQGDLITFDMGGTSTDIALITDAKATLVRSTDFDGKPLLVPQFDIHTIGSGGGSIARVDESGLLRVGPESAGAQPGPACYGRGGTRPTTTDAQLVLGRIQADRFLGGEMQLDISAAQSAIRDHVSGPLGISLEEAALGILEVADTIMAKGVRVVSVNRGHDPRNFKILPFGGAGPMHAAAVAGIVGAAGVLVPLHPGIFSALGMAGADLKCDYSQVVDEVVSSIDVEVLRESFATLASMAEQRLRPAGAATIVHTCTFRLRYAWQDNDVVVTLEGDELTAQSLDEVVDQFHRQHHFEFGHSDSVSAVEIAAIGVESVGMLSNSAVGEDEDFVVHDAKADVFRPVYFEAVRWIETPVFERGSLLPGARIVGPSIIEEREATTVVPPGSTVKVDAQLNITISFQQ